MQTMNEVQNPAPKVPVLTIQLRKTILSSKTMTRSLMINSSGIGSDESTCCVKIKYSINDKVKMIKHLNFLTELFYKITSK